MTCLGVEVVITTLPVFILWDIVKLRGVFDSVPVATAEVKGVWQYNVGLFISYVFVIRHLRAFEAREVAVGVVMSVERHSMSPTFLSCMCMS